MQRRILFVLNPAIGRNSCWVRAQLFKDIFEKSGWIVNYVVWLPEPSWYFLAKKNYKNDAIYRLAQDYDIIYIIKVSSVHFVERLQLTSHAKVVFDLNDALWDANHNSGWGDLDKILRRADAVFAENEYLAMYARARNKFVRIIPDSIPMERFDEIRLTAQKESPDKIIIGWVGSPGTLGALHSIKDPLEHVFQRHPDLELQVLGCSDASMMPVFEYVRYRLYPDGYNEEALIRRILNIDIGLFPPPFDIDEYCSRGALKAVLYMAGAVPCVCQRAGECEKLIQDGITGMLAETPDEWVQKLDALIASPQFRSEMGKSALGRVRGERSLLPIFEKFNAALMEVVVLPQRSWFARMGLAIRVPFYEIKFFIYSIIWCILKQLRSIFLRI